MNLSGMLKSGKCKVAPSDSFMEDKTSSIPLNETIFHWHWGHLLWKDESKGDGPLEGLHLKLIKAVSPKTSDNHLQ